MSESTHALEREAEQTRARIADTAESLRAKMSPGQMVDEVTAMLRGGDGEKALMNFKNQVRDNPLPLALVGAGLAWLALGRGTAPSDYKSVPDTRRDYSNARPIPASAFRDPAYGEELDDAGFYDDEDVSFRRSDYALSDDDEPGILERSKDAASDAWDSATSAVSDAADAVSDKVSDLRASASRAGSKASDRAAHLRARAEHGGAKFGRDAKHRAENLANQASDLFNREPLVTAAVGLAVGALIGALLPHTRVEDEKFGPLADDLKDQAKSFASETVEQAKDVAGETYAAAKAEAHNQGLDPSDVDTGNLNLADRVGSVIKSAAKAGEDAARDRLSEPSAAPKPSTPAGSYNS